MPAYNAEKYIANTISCILAQSCGDFELIVVNDGSTDGTADVVRSFADRRIRLLSVENGGPARARNAALDSLESCDWIMFVDADDAMQPDLISSALEAADGADIVLQGFTIVNPDGTTNEYSEPAARYSSNELGAHLQDLYKANLLNQVWAKLFRADLILSNGIRFPDYRWGEDRMFVFSCLEKADSVAVSPACGYRYLMHPGDSLITGWYDRKLEACISADKAAHRMLASLGGEDSEFFRYMFLKSVFSCFAMLNSPSCPLSGAEKKRYVSEAISDPYVKEHCSDVRFSASSTLISRAIERGSVPLLLFYSNCASFLSDLAPMLFQKIKHRK